MSKRLIETLYSRDIGHTYILSSCTIFAFVQILNDDIFNFSCKQSHKDFVTGISWSPDGSKLYSCGWDCSVKCHNVTTGSILECGQASNMEVNGAIVNGNVSAPSLDSEGNAPVAS
jgi:WD40 repeat protein